MAVSTFRAPGMRWPVPNLLTCFAVAGLGLAGWAIFTAAEEERRMQALFESRASYSDRVRSAESWARQGAEGIPRLKEALTSADSNTKFWGLLALTYMPRQQARLALPEVIRLCDDPEPKVQMEALVLAVRLSETPEQIAPLIASRLLSSNPKLVQAAQIALQKMGPAAVPSIAATYREAPPDVQVDCLHLLMHSTLDDQYGAQAGSVISECLRSRHAYVRQRAYELISAIRPLDPQEVSLGLKDSDPGIVKIALKEWTIDPNRDAAEWPRLVLLLSELSALRIPVLEAIAAHGPSGDDLFSAILPEAESRDPAVRALALVALVRAAGDPERVRSVLLRGLLDADVQVARQSGELLAEMAPDDLPEMVRSVLMPRLHSQEESVQRSAVAALSGMPAAAASERLALIRLLSVDSSEKLVSPAVQFGLAEALGNMGSEAQGAAPALLNLIQRTPVHDSRLCVPIAALARIGYSEPAALNLLIELYEQRAPRRSPLKVALLEAFSRLGRDHADVIDLVMNEALASKTPRVRVAALRAVPHLAVDSETAEATYSLALENENVNVRIAACLLLAEHGSSDETVLELAKRLEDDICLVRVVAARSLAALGPAARGALPALVTASEDSMNAFSHNLADWEEGDEEEEKVDWDLFDAEIQALSRTSVHAAVQSALLAIQSQDRPLKTALAERKD